MCAVENICVYICCVFNIIYSFIVCIYSSSFMYIASQILYTAKHPQENFHILSWKWLFMLNLLL